MLVNAECYVFVIGTVKMEAATFSETTVAIYKITLYHNHYTTLNLLTSLVVPGVQIMYKSRHKPRRHTQSPLKKTDSKVCDIPVSNTETHFLYRLTRVRFVRKTCGNVLNRLFIDDFSGAVSVSRVTRRLANNEFERTWPTFELTADT